MLEIFSKNKDKIAPAAIILTALFSGVVVEEVKDTLGTTVLYHPLTVWFVLFCIVFVQTKSFVISLACVVGYQVIKMVWTQLGLEPAGISRMRKVFHSVTSGEDISDDDIHFLDKTLPAKVAVIRKE